MGLFDVLSETVFERRAARSVPLQRGTVPRQGEVFDYLARLVMDALPENREAIFLDRMKPYLQTESATERWRKINAIANAFDGNFAKLVRYFEANGLPTRYRRPPVKKS